MADPTIIERQPEDASHGETVSNRRLWFEFAATVIAWHVLGVLEVVITWAACTHDEQFGGPSSHPAARALYFVAWAAVFGINLVAARMSYRSWRRLSDAPGLLCAEGRERKQFMSLAGLFISLTLGLGFVWLCLPLFILQMCARAR